MCNKNEILRYFARFHYYVPNMSITRFDEFLENQSYEVYFNFDQAFSSLTGLFTGFLYTNEQGHYEREENVSEETIANGPAGLWLDDEPILFEDISSVFKKF